MSWNWIWKVHGTQYPTPIYCYVPLWFVYGNGSSIFWVYFFFKCHVQTNIKVYMYILHLLSLSWVIAFMLFFSWIISEETYISFMTLENSFVTCFPLLSHRILEWTWCLFAFSTSQLWTLSFNWFNFYCLSTFLGSC